ncbi:MAG: acetate kinase [Desulfobulbaceae bacterium]|nr:MAG: acetate kinase [Desulfobulbaceae bacterium]
MKVLVINSGSSSIKYQLLDMSDETVLASGLVERIGEHNGLVRCQLFPDQNGGRQVQLEEKIPDHQSGMRRAVDLLTNGENGVIAEKSDIGAICHRVVHGGEDFQKPITINEQVIEAIEKNIPLAPLHNPANLDGIRVARELFPGTPQIAVFDTAFHQTIPDHAHIYALPYEYYQEHRVRRYGFHGTSHKYVAGECAALLGKPLEECNLITVHLGNGCSITAVENGCSVDTTLGMTPLEGLVMGTRCGDLDPAIHVFLHRQLGYDIEKIDEILNKRSGLKGICGMNDMRDIHAEISKGNERARLALAVQTYRNRKYIAAYMAVLGRVDGLVFTAGIGENDPVVREQSLQGFEMFGIKLDPQLNSRREKSPFLISAADSKVAVWVIPTNEELAIARESIEVLKSTND